MADLTLFALLNTSLLGVYTHKLAMDVTAHNVANASTPGYSRQRPEIEAMPPIPMTTLTQPSYPLQIGTGSRVKTIIRVRDEFLDVQYRQVNNRYNFWDTTLSNLHFLEQLFAEPGENGIRYLFDMFWAGLEEVINDPSNVAAKQELISRAKVLANNLKDLYHRIDQLRDDINDEIQQRVNSINSMLHQIAELNNKIRIGMVMKAPPNDLMDKRDLLLDKLSELVDVHYKVGEDGQIFLRIGDQLVVNGGTVNEIKLYERPYGKGYYELFVGSSKLHIYDGKLRSLLDLRDNTLVKYMNRLDEFALFLADKLNLIHRDGFTSQGTTNIDFFKPIAASGGDPAIFRIMGVRKMVGGPIQFVTGLHGYDNQNDIRNTPFAQKGMLVLFDGSGNFGEMNINSGDTISDVLGNSITAGSSQVTFYTGQHSPEEGVTKYRFYIDETGDNNLNDELLIDVTGTVLKTMGLPTTTKKLIVISEDNLSSIANKSFLIKVSYGETGLPPENFTMSFGNSPTLSDIETQINSNLSGLKAHVYTDPNSGKSFLILAPTSNINFDLNNVTIDDQDGFFTLVNAQTQDFVVLDPKPTLENIFNGSTNFDPTTGFEITIGETSIHVDPTTDTLSDLAERINNSNTGVLADVTPHGKFVLRASRMYDFDLRMVTIEAPQGFWEGIGFTDYDSNPGNFSADWSTNDTITSPTQDYSTIRNKLSLSEFLTFDRAPEGEPLKIVEQFDLSSTVEYSPENIALDIGYVHPNTDWNAIQITPTGPSNTDILKLLSKSRFEKLLDDGKVSLGQYFGAVVAELGVEGELANKMKVNNEILRKEIDNARETVKGVSLDEEMANMIKYQHAFNAAARVISAVDEMIGRVIDRLGVVGR